MDSNVFNIISIPGFTDPFSSLIHLLAALIFLILSVVLVRKGRGSISRVSMLVLFSFACIFQLAISGSYHILDHGPGRDVLQRIDHAAIFLLIAASFTTIHGIIFKGFMRWGFLFLVWAIAITGLTLKTIYFESIPEWLGLTFYLSLGWLGCVTFFLLCKRFGIAYNRLLIYSGLAYTIGAVLEFIRMPVLISGVVGPHELFHIAVVIGIAFHWRYTFRFADGYVTLPDGEILYEPNLNYYSATHFKSMDQDKPK